jgi:hypothetical protein
MQNKDNTVAVIQSNMTDAVTMDVKSILEQSIQGQEQSYQQLLKLAVKATFSSDWIDMGGKPYLQQSGVARIALRFGVSVKFDRDNQGNPLIMREDFEDEKYGKGYVYTVCGKAIVGDREFEAIGTASTQDQFLGMEGKGESRKAVALHESMQDAKKKAVTNFYNNAISQIIGIKGMSWDGLAQYGIGKGNKSNVSYGVPKEEKPVGPLPVIDKNKPYWTWDTGKSVWLYVHQGDHYTAEWLSGNGFKPTQKDPMKWGSKYSVDLFTLVEAHYDSAQAEQGPY